MEVHENLSLENIEGEIWKEIEGYNGDYFISNFGRVKSFKKCRGKNELILKQYIDNKGYYRVRLYIDKKSNKKIHRLVLETFNPIDNMDKLQVNHINGIKSDNRLENLEWCTQSENMKHSFKIGLEDNKGENNPNHTLKNNDIIEIRIDLKEGILTQREIAKRFNVSQRTIWSIEHGKMWSNVE